MVSKPDGHLPEPLSPVIPVRLLRGISTVMVFRLCWRAPRTVILLMATKSIVPIRKSPTFRQRRAKRWATHTENCGVGAAQGYSRILMVNTRSGQSALHSPSRRFEEIKVAVGKFLLHLPYYRRPCASGIFWARH